MPVSFGCLQSMFGRGVAQPKTGRRRRGTPVMPTYSYLCATCEKKFDSFHSMHCTDPQLCPICGKPGKKLLSAGSIIFRGSGFYSTDYRDSGYIEAQKRDNSETSSSKDNKDTKNNKDSKMSKDSGKPSTGSSTPSASGSAGDSSSKNDSSAQKDSSGSKNSTGSRGSSSAGSSGGSAPPAKSASLSDTPARWF